MTLSCTQSSWNSIHVSQVKLVVSDLGTSSSKDYCILWKSLCEFSVVASLSLSSVTACHYEEFPDSSGLHCLNNLVCKCKYLCVGKSSNDLASLNFSWSWESLGMLNHF